MSWQNATAYILDDLDKNHKDEKLMHTFWRVYYEKNTARLLSKIFALKILCNGYKNKAQSRARLYGKYNEWKNRTRAKHAAGSSKLFVSILYFESKKCGKLREGGIGR